jgi:PAS domain S-box-containing protein
VAYANLQLTRRATERREAAEALHRSERHLRAILDHSPALISTRNLDGVFTQVNRRFDVLAHPPAGGFVGKSVFAALPAEAAAQMWKSDLAALEADGPVETEEAFEHQDGTSHTYLSVKFPLKDARGQVHSICSISTDITDRNNALKDLYLTRWAMDHCADAAYWMSRDGDFVYVNEAACRSLGYTHDELMAMTVFDIDPDMPRAGWFSHWEQTRQQGSTTIETYHRAKDGRVFPVEISCNPLTFQGQEYNCAFARDIAERRQHESQAARAQKLESIGVLAGGIAHDFNNLLTGVLGNISLARAETDLEVVNLILDRAERAATRAAALTKRLLTFSKGGDPILEPADIARIVRDAAIFAATGSTVELDFAIPEELYPVEIDEGQIGQAVHDLVLNAI